MAVRRHDTWGAPRLTRRSLTAGIALTIAASVALVGCGGPNKVIAEPSLAPPGYVGYVACPNAVTPVELGTDIAEPKIALPISGTPAPGDFAIATSANGHWAYVVTTEQTISASGLTDHNVVIPINLVTQRADAPIAIPGSGGTHGIVVFPDGLTLVAASGSTLVPINLVNGKVGTPLALGAGRQVFGMALNPAGTELYVQVSGAVIPVDTAYALASSPIPTGLTVSSIYSPHGIVVNSNGSTVYVIGQGGKNYGGRLLPIDTHTGVPQPEVSFDQFGIAAPAALTVTPNGSTAYVVDSANNWVNAVRLKPLSAPSPPVRLPPSPGSLGGTQHPSDIVLAPNGVTAFVVDGFDSVIPYTTTTRKFGSAIPVCSGASSMAVAPEP
ncbi:MAG: YncE family protein [Acidimicrobiales bacterium]